MTKLDGFSTWLCQLSTISDSPREVFVGMVVPRPFPFLVSQLVLHGRESRVRNREGSGAPIM